MSLRMTSSLARLAALLLAGLLSAAACAQTAGDAAADDDKTWKEADFSFPAAPQDGDLLPFYVSPLATMRFAVDQRSITVSKDGVVRYSLVVTSPSGARNVSFEGIHCEEKRLRVYAFGQPDGSWSKSRRTDWNPIRDHVMNRQHFALATEYLCVDGMVVGTPEQIVKRIRQMGGVGSNRGPYNRVGVDTQY